MKNPHKKSKKEKIMNQQQNFTERQQPPSFNVVPREFVNMITSVVFIAGLFIGLNVGLMYANKCKDFTIDILMYQQFHKTCPKDKQSEVPKNLPVIANLK